MPRILLLLIVTGLAAAACGAKSDPRDVSRAGRSTGDIALSSDTTAVAARVTHGATLASILRAHHVVASDVAEIVSKVAAVFDLRKVRVNQPYRLTQTTSGAVRGFEYEIDGDRFLRVGRSDENALVATVAPIPKTRSVEIVSEQIDRRAPSLVAALDAAGETIDLTLALAEIFAGEIDFNTEVQPGDRFQLAVEKQYRDDHRFAGYGPVLAAEFVNAGRRVRAVRFTPDGGSPGYFDERGVSMKRFLLASPLKFQPVVTSGFSRHRFHPILRESRAHLGVDYRAPAGSPVVAVADGVVLSAGMSGGSGRLVHLRHANGLESEYLHLSSIAVRAGTPVRQGEIIGRVGSTGLATAPHLDFRLKKNGAFINPVTAHRRMPPSDPVPASEMSAFTLVRDRAFERLANGAAVSAARRANN
ncbi:MAG: M23 family metallopeptidase [Acidobacteria bacterium]|nr:M23 family metallopeptidase [Acidobacteriota bacterium]